jgi:uncharacterized protein YlxW (UPF0749 family)
MAITNIESTGFNSLFQASSNLARQAIEANTPTPKEKILKADNRSLSRENFSLEAQNKLLSEQNDELEKDNKSLTQQVKEYQKVENTYQSEFDTNNTQSETRSVEKAKTADDIASTKSPTVSITPQQTESPTVNSNTPNFDISGIELGNSFNSFA